MRYDVGTQMTNIDRHACRIVGIWLNLLLRVRKAPAPPLRFVTRTFVTVHQRDRQTDANVLHIATGGQLHP